ncbi:hypothetical protein PENARI_c051G02525 [Penicillium arizonense]|uniref:EthD domain-containing protein n=1 Tax=Penicillium arizonense TaxID=1835702 RepID=A0A1F5L215_PENAI|nr:hypothetical protein PENARI_c051G02525 [Penicillium arizonense]OGE47278.1 hypothetical protein PENARI_c051G02525 [Penicillium arizonense]
MDSENPYESYITASFYFKKQQGISHEEFYRHWSTFHANMAISCKPFTVSFRRYVQMHATQELQMKGSELGMEILDYDACAVFHVRNWDTFVKLMPEWQKELGTDAARIMQMPPKIFVSRDVVLFG